MKNQETEMAASVDLYTYNDNDAAINLNDLPLFISKIRDNDHEQIYAGISALRKLLSNEYAPPINEVIDSNIVPRIIQLLEFDNHHIQFEAIWTLTNIASGSSEQTRVIVDAGALNGIIKCLQHTSRDIREQSIWVIGNIAGDSIYFRDFLLTQNTITHLLKCVTCNDNSVTTHRNLAWTFSNLCRGTPQPPWHMVKLILPYISTLLDNSDENTLIDACWSLSYLSDGTDDRIQDIINTGVCPKIIRLLGSNVSQVQLPALRSIGNIISGNDAQTDYILNTDFVLIKLRNLLSSDQKFICKEACWTISNVTAGSSTQLQKIIDLEIFPILIQLMENSPYPEVQKEVAWAIANATITSEADQINYLVNLGCIEALFDLVSEFLEVKTLLGILEGLDNILCKGQKAGVLDSYLSLFEECGGLDKLEDLQNHLNDDVYGRVSDILDFFNVDDIEE